MWAIIIICIIGFIISKAADGDMGTGGKVALFGIVCAGAFALISIFIPFFRILAIGVGVITILILLVMLFIALFMD